MQLVITEKPSVAMSIAAVIGADERKDGYIEGAGYLVSWCGDTLRGLRTLPITGTIKNGVTRTYPYSPKRGKPS